MSGRAAGGAARVELRHVSKQFGDVRAVDDISVTIEPRMLVTVLGPSGCGKSTTLRLIAGLDFPTAGDILIGGRDVSMLGPGERGVAMVFPSTALFRHMTVLENVRRGVQTDGISEREASERTRAVLSRVGLEGLERRLPSELSAGQHQRVTVACALVREPAVLLFDEPLSNLDAALRRRVRDEIRELQQRLGLTVVYVTHDQSEAMAVADSIIVMRRGAVAQAGTPREIYEAPDSAFVASVLGDANRVKGRLETHDGAMGIVEIGPLRLRLPHRDQPIGPVDVAIRPEAIVIEPPGTGLLAATVVKAVYCGPVLEYTLSTAVGDLLAIAPSSRAPLSAGDVASFTLRDRGVVILPHG
jgi:iron(III) transport system ATP-binding protein